MLLQLAIPILLATAGVDACRERETTKQPEVPITIPVEVLTTKPPEVVSEDPGLSVNVENPLAANSSLTIGVQAKIEYNATFLTTTCQLPDGYEHMMMTIEFKALGRAFNATFDYAAMTLEWNDKLKKYGFVTSGIFVSVERISCHAYNGNDNATVKAEIEDMHNPGKCKRNIQALVPINTTSTVGVQAKIEYNANRSIVSCVPPNGYEHAILTLEANHLIKNVSTRLFNMTYPSSSIKLACAEELEQYGTVVTEEVFVTYERIWCHAYNGNDNTTIMKELEAINNPPIAIETPSPVSATIKLSTPTEVQMTTTENGVDIQCNVLDGYREAIMIVAGEMYKGFNLQASNNYGVVLPNTNPKGGPYEPVKSSLTYKETISRPGLVRGTSSFLAFSKVWCYTFNHGSEGEFNAVVEELTAAYNLAQTGSF